MTLEEIFNTYHNKIKCRLINKLPRNYSDIEDVTMEIIYTAYEKQHQLERPSNMTNWIAAMTSNKIFDIKRRCSIVSFISIDSVDHDNNEENIAGYSLNMNSMRYDFDGVGELMKELFKVNDFSGDITDNYTRKKLGNAILKLKPNHRDIIVNYVIKGKELKTVALELGIPEGTAKSRMHRAVAKLRMLIAE